MKRFKEFKLSRGWRVTVRRPECLMEVPPVLGVRASGTGQLYEHRLHLARYWLQVLYGAYCVGGSANTVGTPLCKRTLGWLQPWVCTSVITWKKKKKERKKKNLWRQLSFAASQRLECYWLKETWLTANKNSEKSLCVGWGREREKKSFHRRASFKKKIIHPAVLRSGLLWAAFCCFALASRPAASAEPDFLCDVGLTLLLNMKVKKKPQKPPPTPWTAARATRCCQSS